MKRRYRFAGISIYWLSLGITVAAIYPRVSSATRHVPGQICARPMSGKVTNYTMTGYTAISGMPFDVICPLDHDETTQVQTVTTIWIDGFDQTTSTEIKTNVCWLSAFGTFVSCSAQKGSGIAATGHFTIEYRNVPGQYELPSWEAWSTNKTTTFAIVRFAAFGDKIFGFSVLQ